MWQSKNSTVDGDTMSKHNPTSFNDNKIAASLPVSCISTRSICNATTAVSGT